MTGRERVRAAIEFQEPDRVPFACPWYEGALWKYGRAVVNLIATHPDDFGNAPPAITHQPAEALLRYTDDWGVTWERSREYSAGEVREAPLADWGALSTYTMPDEPSDAHYEQMRARTDWRGYWLYGWFDTFERMQYLRGSQNVFIDLAEDRDELQELAEMLTRRNVRILERVAKTPVDGVWLSDDWGSQSGLLIDPHRWRTMFKPLYKRMIEPLKNEGKHVFFHTCGLTCQIWDDFVEMGVDALNAQIPIAPPAEVQSKLKGRICVFSDVDRQHAMPHGTPAAVREHIRRLIELCGTPRGGVMMRGELEAVWPLENIAAMFEAYDEFGELREVAAGQAQRPV